MNEAWRLRQYQSLPSTSDLCAALAQAGEPERLAILAARQTAGRGSRGRTWETLPGNLALSVLLRPEAPPSAAGHWALLAALALAEALEANGAPPLRLKWPNDVMLDGRKLGGILLDTGIEAARLNWLVIGFGANLAAAPEMPTATKLPTPASSRAVALSLLDRLDHWSVLSAVMLAEEPSPAGGRGQGEGGANGPMLRRAEPTTLTPTLPRQREREQMSDFTPLHAAWLARGPALGTPLRLTLGAHEITGTFAGLSDIGALLLQSDGRVRAFSTGNVLQGA